MATDIAYEQWEADLNELLMDLRDLLPDGYVVTLVARCVQEPNDSVVFSDESEECLLDYLPKIIKEAVAP